MSSKMVEQIYVCYGKQRFKVASYEDASRKWNQFRDATGAGASELGADAMIENSRGRKIARISYNGRIWGIAANKAQLICESVR